MSKILRVESLPPSRERKSDLPSSFKTFHVKLQSIEGLKEPNDSVDFHIQALLFDQKYGNFVGSCWKGMTVQNEFSQIHFNQNFYFYTSIPAKDLVLVIELVAPSEVPNCEKSCGWMFLPLLNSEEEESEDDSPMYYKVPLVHGSPISLIPSEDVRKKAKKKKKEKPDPILKKTGLEISLLQAPFLSILQLSHLVPENVIIDASTQIPGLSSLARDASFSLKPQLQGCLTFLLERLCVRMASPRSDVDKVVLDKFQMHQAIATTELVDPKVAKGGIALPEKGAIVQRRLQVGVHNGYCFIQDPDIYHLHVEPSSTPAHSKSLRRASSMGSLSVSRHDCLVVRSDIKLSEVPDDPSILIVFLLEYVISLPDPKEEKKHLPSSLNKRRTANIAIVWGSCRLGTLKEDPSQSIELTCDPSTSPHRILFLSTQQQFEISFSAFSLLKQNKNLSNSYPFANHSSDLNSSGKSEESSRLSYFRPILKNSTPKHKSVADIPMAVEQNDNSKKMSSKTIPRRNENNMALQEVTLVSSSLPVVPPQLHSFPLVSGETFKTFTKLYWDKLQPVLDHNGKPAFLIDTSVPYTIDADIEFNCPPQKNECAINILALSGLSEHFETPPEIFLTFQFYRFLPLRSESLLLKPLSDDESYPKNSQVYAFHKLDDRGKMPGFQVAYNVDPTELNKGEYRSFLHYLMKQTLFVDLWNGQSLLYVGTAALPLKYFCRQVKEAVVCNLELDIVNCEYPDDSLGQGHTPTKPFSGKLHLQVSSIRHPLSSKALDILEEENDVSNSLVIKSKADENSTGKPSAIVFQARRIAETNKELSRLLSNRCVVNNSNTMAPDPQLTEERRRKLARMEAVRKLEQNQDDKDISSAGDGMQFFFKERQKDLLSIQSYIEKNKSEIIQSFLHSSVTSHKTIYPTVGSKTFFEFVIENPFPEEKQIEVVWKCPDLCIVDDLKMWQALRTLHGMSQKVEPLPLSNSSQDIRSLTLQPQQKIHVPFTYECSSLQSSQLELFKTASGHNFSTDVLSSIPAHNTMDSCFKVRFLTDDQKLLAVLNLKVQPLPPNVTHTFKFLSMEHSMFQKSIQVNGDFNANAKFTVKCLHPEVICSIQDAQSLDDRVTVHIKAPTKSSGKSTEFYVFIYKNQMAPAQTWSISVRPLQRIDLSCVAGQMTRSSLLVRGTHATNLVRCSSSSKELLLHPSEPFVLSPFAVQELSMNARCLMPGTKYFQITMVNQSLDQILQSWLLVLSCQKPSVTKAFQVHLSVGKETAKRITYVNPYPSDRSFTLHCTHPELLQLREHSILVAAGGSCILGLYFVPQEYARTETVFLYLNDSVTDTTKEAYCVRVVCQ
ncbi:hypothetical protein JTE90_027480 [Oedothorax gibbosus]|uniref:Nephrocystin-4 n=1 Tax=Oedothorax gibbosus TaxID=931172 RepID=A0AAV6UGW3_9ARAC|nr:hypothetical protein JTE90_027480 [Oedothorax gibbosus]